MNYRRLRQIINYRIGQVWFPLVWRFSRSETSKCRMRLGKFCLGAGVDLGFGGDPINETAVRIDFKKPYTKVGRHPVQLGGDVKKLHWFQSETLDFVYSSHVLEDFEQTEEVLREWLRVLRKPAGDEPGGRLVVFCPDQKRYEQFCARKGQRPNAAHFHADFSLEFVKARLPKEVAFAVVHECPDVDVYSWELVIERL